MFRITVTGVSSDELIISYVVNVSHSHGDSWQITKSYEEFVTLRESLHIGDVEIPNVPESREANDIEVFLRKLVSLSSLDMLYQWKPLWKFLDDRQVENSRVIELICLTTHMQVAALKAENATFSQQLLDLTFKYEQLVQIVSGLVANQSSEQPTEREWRPSMDAVADIKIPTRVVPPTAAPPGFERSASSNQLNDHTAVKVPSFSPFKETPVGGQTWLTGVSPTAAAAAAAAAAVGAGVSAHGSHNSTTSSSPVVFSARTDSGKDLSSMDVNDQETALATAGIASFGLVPEAVSNRVSGTPVTPTTAVAAAAAPKEFRPRPATAVDRAVDAILTLLTPYESQTLYRSSVVGMLRKQCKLSLPFCNVYETGIHGLNCNLPDDPLLLTAIFSKNHSTNWCKNVLYRLSLVVEGCTAAGGYMAMKKDDPRFEGDDFKALANHMISNAHYVEVPTGVQPAAHLKTNYEVVNKVRCVVDALECEIAPNNRSDVCLLSFFEEVAVLVGQNDLFKRSILLIRAWWVYETATYVGNVIKHYLPDNAMLIMVTMLFNLYYEEISHPIDALHKLLAVFSKYDGFSELITIQGIVPYAMQNKQQGINVSVSGNQLTLNPPLESHLIPASLLDKYYRLYHCSLFPEPLPFARRPAGSGGLSDASAAAAGVDSEASEVDGGSVGGGTPRTSEDGSALAAASATAAAAAPRRAPLSVSVERHGYNVLHPFSQNNLIPDKMTTRRVVLIHKAFQVGTANLSNLLSGHQWKDVDASSVMVPDIKSYFPACTGRFKDNWRPDALGNSIELISGTKEVAPLSSESTRERLLYQMQYCNFVLEGQVLDNVIMQITVEALESRGGMAVGEIGKLLTEQSSIAHLSQKLKEGFGGLKKLLEKFKDQFVVGTNHQFNPHVLLRSSLTPDQEMQLSAGIFPVELNKVTKKQQQQLQQGPMQGHHDSGNQYTGVMGGGVQNRSNTNYLNYNVNTSLDRRMRQQMNAVAGSGNINGGIGVGGVGVGVSGPQKMSPRMQGSMQPPQMQQHPSFQQQQQQQLPQLSRREKQQLHQQMKMSSSGGGGAHHGQSNSLDVDWTEFGGLMRGGGGNAQSQHGGASSFVNIKSAHVGSGRLAVPTVPDAIASMSLRGGSGSAGNSVLSGTSPSGNSFLGGALGGGGGVGHHSNHRVNHSTGSISNWLLHDEEPEDHYHAAFQQPHGSLSAPGSALKQHQQQQQQAQQNLMGSSHSSFDFDLDSDTSAGGSSAAANVYAGLWGDTSSTSILSNSFPASDLNVNASAFSSQFQMPGSRGSHQ